MQIFPESVQKLWDEWEVRVMVLISLFLQIVLIIFSNRRKYTFAVWLRILIWSAYLSADWVATVCLGTLSNNYSSSSSSSSEVEAEAAADPNKNRSTTGRLMGFWAPFLLLHLGGPGTITAYSLEDNELWLRHLLGLVVHVLVALYVFLRSWRPPISFLSIPMFVAGIIKYGERTWILRSASKQHFGDRLLPLPDPGLDYARIVKGEEPYEIYHDMQNQTKYRKNIAGVDQQGVPGPIVREVLGREYIMKAYLLFKKQLRYLYADLILSLDDQKMSEGIIRSLSSKEAFKVVEAELSFLYDVLYTKATLLYSPLGFLLRAISFASTISTFVAFIFFTDRLHESSKVDISITYVLLFGAIFLEIYAFFVLILSDWSFVWFKHYNSSIIEKYLFPDSVVWRKRWCRRMGQSNLIDYCLRDRTKYDHDHGNNLFDMSRYLERYWYMTWEKVDEEMIEEPIFRYLLQMTEGVEDVKKLLRCRGDYVITKKGEIVSSLLGWSIVDVEFDYSILLWHLATDLYNNSDGEQFPNSLTWREISKRLSEYMLYLLVMCPFMLPKGIGKFRFRDTCSEAKRFFEHRKSREVSIVSMKTEACRLLLEVETEVEPKKVKGDKSKSVLFEACRLAKMLKYQLPVGMDSGERWEMISGVWVEMLCYAASHCGWTQHGQQLRRGGELLTHVCLLMSHLGLSDQFQILEGEPKVVPRQPSIDVEPLSPHSPWLHPRPQPERLLQPPWPQGPHQPNVDQVEPEPELEPDQPQLARPRQRRWLEERLFAPRSPQRPQQHSIWEEPGPWIP